MWYFKKRNDVILPTKPNKSTFPDRSSPGKAKLRLETALSNLEKVLEEKADQFSQRVNSTYKLNIAKKEIADLKKKNDSISARLDSAIAKMKKIIGE